MEEHGGVEERHREAEEEGDRQTDEGATTESLLMRC